MIANNSAAARDSRHLIYAKYRLRPIKIRALEMYAAGMNTQQVSEALGVSRQTLWRWRERDPEFQAAMNAINQSRLAAIHDDSLVLYECALAAAISIYKDDTVSPTVKLQYFGQVGKMMDRFEDSFPRVGDSDPARVAASIRRWDEIYELTHD